jgi:Outer membrane protein beta-barrel domain
MFKGVLFLVATAGLATAAQAQSGFTPGYVVTTASDTLRGEVDVRGEAQNSLTCRFRPAASAAPTEYTPDQLKSYGLSSPRRQYVSRPLSTGKPVFAQVVYPGRLSLYSVVLPEQDVQYFTAKPTETSLILLTQRDTVEVEYDNRQQREVRVKKRFPLFQPILVNLMNGCYPAQALVPKTALNRASLVKLFSVYNTCDQQPARPTAPEDGYRRVRPVLLVGGSLARITYSGYPAFSSDAHVQVGAGLQFNPESFNPRLSLQLQALYARTLFSRQYTVAAGGIFQGQTTREDVYARFQTVQVPLLLRVNLSRSAIRPYLQAGPMAALNFGRESYRNYYQPNSSVANRNEFSLQPFSLGGVGAGGVSVPVGSLGRVQLEGRLTWLGKLSQENNILGGHTKWSVLTAFTFGQ